MTNSAAGDRWVRLDTGFLSALGLAVRGSAQAYPAALDGEPVTV